MVSTLVGYPRKENGSADDAVGFTTILPKATISSAIPDKVLDRENHRKLELNAFLSKSVEKYGPSWTRTRDLTLIRGAL